MRVVYKGVLERKRRGCNCAKSRSEYSLLTRKDFWLLSGKNVTFYLGTPVEVSDADGEELLTYTYQGRDGTETHIFEEA